MQVDFAIEQPVLSFGLGVRLPGLAIAARGRTATCLPTRPVVDSLSLREQPLNILEVVGLRASHAG